MGCGVSGGEEGARAGPALMAGGPKVPESHSLWPSKPTKSTNAAVDAVGLSQLLLTRTEICDVCVSISYCNALPYLFSNTRPRMP